MRRLSDIVCHQNPLVMRKDATVQSACQRMSERQAGSVLVVDDRGELAGIFTGRDAVRRVLAAGKSPKRTRLAAVMTPEPVTMTPDKTPIDALRRMWDGGFRHIPLMDGRRICGVVSRGDFQGDEHSSLEAEIELWQHMR